jgi:hypothetical protein
VSVVCVTRRDAFFTMRTASDALASASVADAFVAALIAGAAHATMGPDHVAAVCALCASARRRDVVDRSAEGGDEDAGGEADRDAEDDDDGESTTTGGGRRERRRRRRREAMWRQCARQGLRWSVGHSLGLGVMTAAFVGALASNERASEKLAMASDYIVGCAMLALGASILWSTSKAMATTARAKAHVEDAEGRLRDAKTAGLHAPEPRTLGASMVGAEDPVRVLAGSDAHREAHKLGVSHTHVVKGDIEKGGCSGEEGVASERESIWKRLKTAMGDESNREGRLAAYVVGLVHGISGLSGVVYVLPAVFLADERRVATYLCGFFLSSTIAMTALAAVVGAVPQNAVRANHFSLVAGVAVFAVGVTWIALTAMDKLDL